MRGHTPCRRYCLYLRVEVLPPRDEPLPPLYEPPLRDDDDDEPL